MSQKKKFTQISRNLLNISTKKSINHLSLSLSMLNLHKAKETYKIKKKRKPKTLHHLRFIEQIKYYWRKRNETKQSQNR